MKLNEKLHTLSEPMIRQMQKQLIKDGRNLQKDWSKSLLYTFGCTDAGDTYLTIFNKLTKKLYSAVVIYNEADIFNEEKGQLIATGRMCKNTDFVWSIEDDSIPEITWDC